MSSTFFINYLFLLSTDKLLFVLIFQTLADKIMKDLTFPPRKIYSVQGISLYINQIVKSCYGFRILFFTLYYLSILNIKLT